MSLKVNGLFEVFFEKDLFNSKYSHICTVIKQILECI